MSARAALLEILAENLPPALVPAAAAQLKKLAAEEISGAGVPCGEIGSYGTCRRLVLFVQDVPLSARKELQEIFPRLLARLEFSRSMSWEPSGFRFPRPVRGLLALHGDRVVAFSLAGLKSGRVTEGHEAAGPRRITVSAAEKYFRSLEHAGVLADDALRRERLLGQLESSSRRMRLRVEQDEKVLQENLCLAEYPVCVVSGFSQEYLSLPPDRMDAVFRSLGFFSVVDSGGRRQPYFAGVRDGASKGQRNVEEGFRTALEERLAAARR